MPSQRLEIYTTEHDKQNLARLFTAMSKEGHFEKHANPSFSAMIRLLVIKELERRNLEVAKANPTT